jgi:hypothetical protein
MNIHVIRRYTLSVVTATIMMIGLVNYAKGTDNASLHSMTPNTDTTEPVAVLLGHALYWPEFKFWVTHINRRQGYNNTPKLINQALDLACYERAIHIAANEMKISLPQKAQVKIARDREKNIEIYGSATEYFRIVSRMYINEEVYNYLQRTDALSKEVFAHWYGNQGQRVTETQIANYLREKPMFSGYYLSVDKHDIKLTHSHSNPLSKMKEWRRRIINSEKPVEALKTLIQRYGKDPKIATYPQGHQFATGKLPSAVERVFSTLEPGQLSEIVEVENELYLVMPQPLTSDTLINATAKNLRYWVAYDGLFKQRIKNKCHAAEYQVGTILKDLTLSAK